MSRHRNKKQNSAVNRVVASLVDIVIPVYNRSDLLKQCLERIPESCQHNPYTIYVFDNGSKYAAGPQDENAAFLIRQYSEQAKAKYIRSGTNIGFPAACNRAANRGLSPLIFFLNDDVFLLPNSLDILISAMDDPKIGIAGMRLLFPLDSKDGTRPPGMIQHVGISTNIRGEFFHQYSGWSPDNPRTFKIRNPYAVTGAALLTRRKLFKQAGYFHEGYGIGTYEDVDYCLTVREMGYNICIEHNAIGFHMVGATAVSQNIPYPLNSNRDIFRVRWGNKLVYTEWENW